MEAKLLTAERFVDINTGISYRYILSTTEYFRPHFHNYYEMFFMLDGKAQHIVNGNTFSLETGDVVFIRPEDTHDYVCIQHQPFSMLNITFTTDVADEIFKFLGDGFNCNMLLSCKFPPQNRVLDTEFKSLLQQMTYIRTIDVNDYQRLKTALKIFIFNVITKYFNNRNENNIYMPEWLKELCDKMNNNDNFIEGTTRMYKLSGKSREHVARSLKKYTGLTVSEYISELRIKFIANMLINSNHSIADIVFESGFNNLSWASNIFKKKYGITMNEYRKGINSKLK